jgi:outer membrane receptor protein involved in Fe transport
MGRGAFAGVVNINTKRKFKRSFGLRLKGGSFDNKNLLAEIHLPATSKLYLSYLGQINSFLPEIEYFPGERFSDKTLNNSIKTTKQHHHFNMNYFTSGGLINGKIISYFLDYNKPFWKSSKKNYLASFSYRGSLLTVHDFDFNWNVYSSDDVLDRNPTGSARFLSDYQTNRMNLRVIKKLVHKRMEMHILGEYFHDELDSDLNIEDQNFTTNLYNASLYENRATVGGVFSFSDYIESVRGLSWKTIIGARIDFVSNGNEDFLPTIGFQLDWARTLWTFSPYANYGKNVKYPTLFENAYLRDISVASQVDTMFKRLEPEYNNSAEFGIKIIHKSAGAAYKQMELDLAYFSSTVYNKLLRRPFDDLIASEQIGRNLTTGFEASFKFRRMFEYFSLSGGYTTLNIQDPLLYPYKPDERVNAQLGFSHTTGFYLTGRYFYEGKSAAWFYDVNNVFQTVEIAPFYDVDLSVGYKFTVNHLGFDLQFAGYNLLDKAGFRYYYLKKRYLQVSFSIKYL